MKLALLAASLLVVSAPDPTTGEPITTDGETKCVCDSGGPSPCNQGKAGARWEVCSWQQECHTSSNITFSFCVPKGNHVCYKHQYLGTSGNIVSAKSYPPHKSCCDDNACTSRQSCVPLIGGEAATFEYEYDKSDGKTTTMQTHKVWEAARNGWKHKTGDAFNNKPMICIDKVFDVTQGAKQVVAPMFSMVIVIFSIVIGFRNKQMGRLEIVVPLVVIVLSFFLTLSEGWAFALFTMFVAVATMCTPLDHQGKLVLFQVAYSWLYFGGANFFFATPTTDTPTNYFIQASTKKLLDLETSCDTYFVGYFKKLTETTTFDADPTMTTEGLCDRGVISTLIIFAYFQAFALFLMVALTLVSYLSRDVKATFSCLKRGVSPAN